MTLFELVGKIIIDSQGAEEEIDKVADAAQKLEAGVDGANESTTNFGNNVGKSGSTGIKSVYFGNLLTKLTEKAYRFGKTIYQTGIQHNASIEVYEKQFAALLQNDELAADLVEKIKKLAKETPLGIEGLTNNAVSLLNTGTALEDIIPTLEMLGNIALGDQENLNGVARAFVQIMSKGVLLSQEMYQLADRGVPIIEIMTKYGGEEYADGTWYEQKMTDPTYKIPASDVLNAFYAATGPDGKWYNYMYTMMETYDGRLDRLGESAKETAGEVSQPFFQIMADDVLPKLADGLDALGAWASENKDSIESLATAIGNIVTNGLNGLVSGLQWITDNKDTINTALPLIAIAFEALGIAINPIGTLIANIVAGLLWLSSGEAGKAIENLANKVTEATGGVVNANVLIDNKGENENIAINPPDADATAEEIQAWFASVDPEIVKQYGIEPPDASMTKDEIEAWWKTVKPNLTVPVSLMLSTFTMPSYSPYGKGNLEIGTGDSSFDALSALYGGDFASYNRMIMDGSYDPDGSHKTGLDFVPRDNYLARLHQGEAVLTADEAREWRNGKFGRNEEYHDETIISGNTFVIRQESDVYNLAVQIANMKRDKRRGRGAKG